MPIQSKPHPIFLIYHVALIGTWETVVIEQLRLIHTSGLGAACHQFLIHLCGIENREQFEQVKKRFSIYPFSNKMTFVSSQNCKEFEFPTIKLVQKVAAENPTARIL